MKRVNYWPAILLALVFGFVGLQEFYVGNLIRGILAVLFWWTFIPAIVAFIQICRWLYIGENEFFKEYNGNPSDQKISNTKQTNSLYS